MTRGPLTKNAPLRTRPTVLAAILLCFFTHPLFSQTPANKPATPPCGTPDWFAVQKSQAGGEPLSPICKAELDSASDRRSLAERELTSIIKRNPHSPDAYTARENLTHLYFRTGRFKDANAQILAMLVDKPTAPDLANVSSLFALLANFPDLQTQQSHPATIHGEIIEGNLFAPVTINGSSRSYMLDTGANISLISEVEAAHLGLTPQSSTTKVNDISGVAGAPARVVEVENLVIGNTHLSHVPFVVIPDDNGAFQGIPAEKHAILGIQPLLALGAIAFERDATLQIAVESHPQANSVPLLFDGAIPLTQITCQGHLLPVTFDTGAVNTSFNPPLAKFFPELTKTGKTENHDLNGISGTTAQRSVSLPNLSFDFGRPIRIQPATILLDPTTEQSAWAAANLGFDAMLQAAPFILNFRKMTIDFLPAPGHR
jgi:Aspartyl protease